MIEELKKDVYEYNHTAYVYIDRENFSISKKNAVTINDSFIKYKNNDGIIVCVPAAAIKKYELKEA